MPSDGGGEGRDSAAISVDQFCDQPEKHPSRLEPSEAGAEVDALDECLLCIVRIGVCFRLAARFCSELHTRRRKRGTNPNDRVCDFVQTSVTAQCTIDVQATTIKAAPLRKIGARRGAMDDARRYRLNAAECLSAATRCHEQRGLLLSISAGWYALARQDEAVRGLLESWGIAAPAHETTRNAERRRQRASNARDQSRKGTTVGPRSHLWAIICGHTRFDRRAAQPTSQAANSAGHLSGVLR
jgi:hypothetical protein